MTPDSIQRLVSTLEAHPLENSCYEIVVESMDSDRLNQISAKETETSISKQSDWIAVIANAFQKSIIEFIRTIPTIQNRQPWQSHFQELLSPDKTRSPNTRRPVVKVLDSVIPLLYHALDWNEVLKMINVLRDSCQVLIIGLRCDALSQMQVRSIERRASAIVSGNTLLRRGVQEYDRWLREDLLKAGSTRKNEAAMNDTPPPKTSGKIFLQSNDPDLMEYFDDDEDPDDDLDI